MTPAEALDLKFTSMDLGETTIRGYMKQLLSTLFHKGESFSGKRPFGNSGWEYDLVAPLVAAGLVTGEIDGGEVVDHDEAAFASVIARIIEAL